MLVAHDLGWRGDTSVTAHITGVPNALALQLTAAASDFHRESFEPARPLNLHATCTATYRHNQGAIDGIHCLSPVGNGSLALSGAMQQLQTANPEPDLQLVAHHVPADAALELLRHTRGRLNTGMSLSGAIDGQLNYARAPQPPGPHTSAGLRTTAQGSLVASDLLLRSDNMQQSLPDLHFAVQPSTPSSAQPLALVLEPTQIDLGGPQPLLANVRLTRQGYQLHYSGSGLLQQLLPLAHAFNVVPGAFQGLQGNGTADYNLGVQGDWLLPLLDPLVNLDHTTPLSDVSGTVGLHNADLQPSYLAEPVHIATATATILPAELSWNNITATLGTTRFTGSLRIPLSCAAPCERYFDLTAANVSFGVLASSLQGQDEGMVQDLINRVRSRSQDWPLLDGTVHIAHLDLGQIEIANASAELALHDGNLEVRSLEGRTLGGTLHATGAVDLASIPGYDAAVQLRHASAPELAQLLKEHWGPGQIDLASDLMMRGSSAADLASSAKGTLRWNWTSGALPQLTGTPLHRFDRWSGKGKVAKGAIIIGNSEVTGNNTTAVVTGTIASDRSLDLKVVAPAATGASETETAVTMTGTLAAPVIATQ
jgi:hypothetical protein